MTIKVKLGRRAPGRLFLAALLALVLVSSTALGGMAAPNGQPGDDPDGLPVSMEPAQGAEAASDLTPEQAGDDPEATYTADYLELATGELSEPGRTPLYAWPYALQSIGHTISSYQYYGGDPYFHHGIDGRVDANDPVYATSGGQVINIENYQPGNSLYWEVAILDPEGFVWQFHHIEVSTIPQYVWDKYDEYLADPDNGGFVAAGTHIGNVVYWPVVTFGERFNHIHLNILGADGYVNGFAFLEPLADNQTPEILEVGLLQGGQIVSGNEIAGDYGLYARIRDLILHTAFYVPAYEVSISVDGGPEETVWRFDNLPGGPDRYAYVTDYYVVPPTCGDYSCRDFYVNLGFIPDSGRTFPDSGGPHNVVVTARDFAGNETSRSFEWTVLAPPEGTALFFENFEGSYAPDFIWATNPDGTDTAATGFWEVGNPEDTNSSGPKQLGTPVSGDNDLVTGRLAGSGVGSYDVDLGRTSVRSPDIELPASSELVLSFYSYLAHTSSSSADYFRVTVVESTPSAAQHGRAPTARVVWEELGGAFDRDAAWAFHLADISDFAGQTVHLLIEAADEAGQNIVEAAVDDVQITLTGPLAVTLDHFTARAGRGQVLLSWETVSEIDNLGFSLYRSQTDGGPQTLLAFIPSQAPGSGQGFAYTWRDADVVPGTTYWYWLEAVDIAGASTLHGPAWVAY